MQGFVLATESEYKQRDRYERYPRQLPPHEAIGAVLKDEDLDALTAEMLLKELGRAGKTQSWRLHDAVMLPQP